MSKLRKTLVALLATAFMVTSAVAVAACTGKPEPVTYYKVTTSFNADQGNVTVSAPKDTKGYVAQEDVTVTVTAKENFVVGEVKVNDAAVELKDGKYSFKIAKDTTVSATFTPKSSEPEVTYYKVTTSFNANQGSVTVSAPKDAKGYVAQEDVTVTVTAKENFVVGEVKVNDAAVELKDGKYSFKIAKDTTVSATFTPKSSEGEDDPPATEDEFTVTFVYDTPNLGVAMALIESFDQPETFHKDTKVIVRTNPNAGYVTKSVTSDDVTLTHVAENEDPDFTVEHWTFTITKNVTIHVSFEAEAGGEAWVLDESHWGTYTSETADPNTITIGADGVFWGETPIYFSENGANENSYFVLVGGTLCQFVFNGGNINLFDTDFTFDYTFIGEGGSETSTYTVSFSYEATQGSVSLVEGTLTGNVTQVEDGGSVSFTITPVAGYSVASVTANGETVTVGDEGVYTVSEIHTTTAIHIEFSSSSAEGNKVLVLDETYYGTYYSYSASSYGSSLSYDYLKVRETGVYLGITPVCLVSVGETESSYNVSIDDKTYTLVVDSGSISLDDYEFMKQETDTFTVYWPDDDEVIHNAYIYTGDYKTEYEEGDTVELYVGSPEFPWVVKNVYAVGDDNIVFEKKTDVSDEYWEFTVPAKDVVIGIEFEQLDTVTITVDVGDYTLGDEDGSIGNIEATGDDSGWVDGVRRFAVGTKARLDIELNVGYAVQKVEINGVEVQLDEDEYYSFTVAEENMTVVVTIVTVETHTVTVNVTNEDYDKETFGMIEIASENGYNYYSSEANSFKFNAGSIILITISYVGKGYSLDENSVKIDGVEVQYDYEDDGYSAYYYMFTLEGDVTANVSFTVLPSLTVTVNASCQGVEGVAADAMGTVSIQNSDRENPPYFGETQITVTVTPNRGYEVVSVTCSDVEWTYDQDTYSGSHVCMGTMNKSITIVIVYKQVDTESLVLEGKAGTYKCDGQADLVVSEDKVMWGEHEVGKVEEIVSYDLMGVFYQYMIFGADSGYYVLCNNQSVVLGITTDGDIVLLVNGEALTFTAEA